MQLWSFDFLQIAYAKPGTPCKHLLAEDTIQSQFSKSKEMAPKLDMASTKTEDLGWVDLTILAIFSTSLTTPELVSHCTIATRLEKKVRENQISLILSKRAENKKVREIANWQINIKCGKLQIDKKQKSAGKSKLTYKQNCGKLQIDI